MTKEELAALSNSNFPTAGTPKIRAAKHRQFNDAFIAASQILVELTKTQLSAKIVASQIEIGAQYRITDATGGVVRVWGVDANVISTNAVLEGLQGAGLTIGSWGRYILSEDFFWPDDNITDTAPTGTKNETLGFVSMKSRWIDSTTQIEYLCVDATSGGATWFPLTGTIENPVGGLTVTGDFGSAALSGRRDNLRYQVVGNMVTISGPVEFVIPTNFASGGTIEIPIPSPLNIETGGDYGMVISFRKSVFVSSSPFTSIESDIQQGLVTLTFGPSPISGGTDIFDFSIMYQTNFVTF